MYLNYQSQLLESFNQKGKGSCDCLEYRYITKKANTRLIKRTVRNLLFKFWMMNVDIK